MPFDSQSVRFLIPSYLRLDSSSVPINGADVLFWHWNMCCSLQVGEQIFFFQTTWPSTQLWENAFQNPTMGCLFPNLPLEKSVPCCSVFSRSSLYNYLWHRLDWSFSPTGSTVSIEMRLREIVKKDYPFGGLSGSAIPCTRCGDFSSGQQSPLALCHLRVTTFVCSR